MNSTRNSTMELTCCICGKTYEISEDDPAYELAILGDIMDLDFVCAFCDYENAEA